MENLSKNKAVIVPVLHDLLDQEKVRKKEYGNLMMPENGKDSLMDAYQNALQLVMHLRKAILERDSHQDFPPFNPAA